MGVALHFLVVALETRYRRREDGDVRLVLAVADICAAVIHFRGAVLLYRMLASRRAKAGVEESDRLGGALGETDKRKTLDVPRRLGNTPVALKLLPPPPIEPRSICVAVLLTPGQHANACSCACRLPTSAAIVAARPLRFAIFRLPLNHFVDKP